MHVLFKCTQNVCQDVLGHKPNLEKFKRTEITQSVLSDHKIKSDIRNEDIWEIPEDLAFNDTLINNPRVKDEITKLIRRQLAPHENENPARRKFGKHRSQRFRDGAEPCVSGGRSPVGAPRSRFTHRRERTGGRALGRGRRACWLQGRGRLHWLRLRVPAPGRKKGERRTAGPSFSFCPRGSPSWTPPARPPLRRHGQTGARPGWRGVRGDRALGQPPARAAQKAPEKPRTAHSTEGVTASCSGNRTHEPLP